MIRHEKGVPSVTALAVLLSASGVADADPRDAYVLVRDVEGGGDPLVEGFLIKVHHVLDEDAFSRLMPVVMAVEGTYYQCQYEVERRLVLIGQPRQTTAKITLRIVEDAEKYDLDRAAAMERLNVAATHMEQVLRAALPLQGERD